jgi:4-diphosphocytidyl-2-C-methyl-D-erythritol kinase
MEKLTLKSPAKLNLFLKIEGKRPDGFHNLTTLFERIDLCDTLTFEKKKNGCITISCANNAIPTGPRNLVYKVAELLQKEFGIKEGVHVTIDKKIPVAAGMAGGSSNAATALLALNELWDIRLNIKDLGVLARRIGSDVSFFLHDSQWALGTERGDKIKPLHIRQKLWHVAVTPKVKLYAKDVYGIFKMPLTKNEHDVNILLRYLEKEDVLSVSSLLLNDLEAPVLQLCPRLKSLKERIKSLGCSGVLISGSGPTVFGITESEVQAKEVASVLRRRYSRVFVVRTL